MSDWKEHEGQKGNFWNPAIGDELVGTVKAVNEGDYGKQYDIETDTIGDDGTNVVITTPSHKVLQNRMKDIAVGTKVKLVLDSEEPPAVKGQNKMKMYKVYSK